MRQRAKNIKAFYIRSLLPSAYKKTSSWSDDVYDGSSYAQLYSWTEHTFCSENLGCFYLSWIQSLFYPVVGCWGENRQVGTRRQVIFWKKRSMRADFLAYAWFLLALSRGWAYIEDASKKHFEIGVYTCFCGWVSNSLECMGLLGFLHHIFF